MHDLTLSAVATVVGQPRQEVMLNPRLHRRVGSGAAESNVHEMENFTRLGESSGISSSRVF